LNRSIQKIDWELKYANKIAAKGDVPMLAWAIEQGCPMDESTFLHAIKSNKLEVCKWLKKKNCPINLATLQADSLKSKQFVKAWLKQNYPSTFNNK
jgi:hypothetical protein